jgi:hypothetical protein
VVERVERAKAALTESVPGTRLPGRPLAETLAEFEEGLREARGGMDRWRAPELQAEWDHAMDAIDECLGMAEELRLRRDPPQGFEALIGTVGDLLAPLEAFEQAAGRFRSLRV